MSLHWSCSRILRNSVRRRMTAPPFCGCPRDCATRWNESNVRRSRSSLREAAKSSLSSARTGAGRTHFLKALAQWASERGCVTAYVDCQRPFESLVETYRAIAAGMTPPGTHRFFATTGIARTLEARFTDLDAIEQRAVMRTIEG